MSKPPAFRKCKKTASLTECGFSSSQQNGELLPVSFKRSELVNEAETNLGAARLAVESVRLFLGVASETVNVRALAEGIG